MSQQNQEKINSGLSNSPENLEVAGLYVLHKSSQRMKELDSFSGKQIVILVVVDPKIVAGNFDEALIDLEKKAQEASIKLNSRGILSKIIVEWGDKTESIANTLQRENAKLLNKD